MPQNIPVVSGPETSDGEGSAIDRAHGIVNSQATYGQFVLTDLTRTSFADVCGPLFRLFVPVKASRMRLPTSLPEFAAVRHDANLSDSPLTAAHKLGGHWTDHNLAAITHVAACNFRCSYCYVDYRHLAGHDALEASPAEIVASFLNLRSQVNEFGADLTILRISGGEPLLSPELIVRTFEEIDRRVDRCLLKIESNLSVLRHSLARLAPALRRRWADVAPSITLHGTIHPRPGTRNWPLVSDGLAMAFDHGLDLYPAIGGEDWTDHEMEELFDHLSDQHRDLPRRLAVRPFDRSYPIVQNRRRRVKETPLGPAAHDRRARPSLRWEQILKKRTGHTYLDMPRHLVSLD